MRSEFQDGRLLLFRDDAEREPLLTRLRRIEGQVRGLQQMIQNDRYCGEELQQGKAVIAAMQEVMRLLAMQHLQVGLQRAEEGQPDRDLLADLEKILSAAMK